LTFQSNDQFDRPAKAAHWTLPHAPAADIMCATCAHCSTVFFHGADRQEPAMSDDNHPLYLEGIKHFNECDFFEAHEVWEELWTDYRGESRKFYQGLIQAAVALFHFGNGNIRGARKLFHSSSEYLSAYGPRHLGLDVEKFLGEFKRCFAEVIATSEEFPKIEVDPELIPEIHLDI
jgi:predicted metal-dependent hydrolase